MDFHLSCTRPSKMTNKTAKVSGLKPGKLEPEKLESWSPFQLQCLFTVLKEKLYIAGMKKV